MISIKSIYLYIYWWVNHNLGKSPILSLFTHQTMAIQATHRPGSAPGCVPPAAAAVQRPAPSTCSRCAAWGERPAPSGGRSLESGKKRGKIWGNLRKDTDILEESGQNWILEMSTAWSVTMYRWLDESCSLWWRFLRFLSTDRSKPPKQRQNQIRLSHTLMTLIWKYPLKGGMAGMVIQVGLDLLLDGSILVAQKSPWDGPPSWLLSFWKCENLPILISLTYHQCSHVCSLGVYHGNGILTMVYCLSFWHINSSLPSIILNITSQTHTNFAIDYRL